MITPPIEATPNAITDWLETCLLVAEEDNPRLSDADLTDALDEAEFDDPDGQLANLRTQVERRTHVIGDRYPFERRGQGFARRMPWPQSLPYSFMLLVSLNQLYAELNFAGGAANEPAELFEFLAGHALAGYVGGRFIRIGAHRRPPVPAAFSGAVAHLAEQLSEIYGYGELEDQASGDDGLDLAVWKSFPDANSGQLVILGQCAIGTNWKDKRSELDLGVWTRHVRWAVPPTKAFAIPFHHNLEGTWRETAARGGIVFDRGRIVSCLPDGPLPDDTSERMRAWCNARLPTVLALA